MFCTSSRRTRGSLSVLAGLAALWLGASTVKAEQFVLFDSTFTFTKKDADNSKPSPSRYYVRDKLMNTERPKNWTNPVDYRPADLCHRNQSPLQERVASILVACA